MRKKIIYSKRKYLLLVALQIVLASLIIDLPFLVIRQDLVRPINLLELVGSRLVALVLVRVVLLGEAAERFLNVRLAGLGCQFQKLVEVLGVAVARHTFQEECDRVHEYE